MNRLSIALNIRNDLLDLAIDLQVRLVTATLGGFAFGGVVNRLQGCQISTEQAERCALAREA
jgi:hypothetical protein